MPDDILDSAQKAINDAAKNTGGDTAGSSGTTSNPISATPPKSKLSTPPEPPPVSPVSPKVTMTVETPSQTVSMQTNPTSDKDAAPAEQDPAREKMVSALLDAVPPPVPAVTPQPSEPPHVNPPATSAKPKKKPNVAIIAVIAAILLTLPIAVYFISRQNQQIADIRNQAAWDTVYQGCTINPDSCKSKGAGWSCHCQNGEACTNTACEFDIERNCREQGRAYCTNSSNGNAKTCCYPGYVCGANDFGCIKVTNPPKTPTNPPPPPPTATLTQPPNPTATPTRPPNVTNTPTPTTSIGACLNIRILKDKQQVDPSTLKPGDKVTISFGGSGSPTKGRFRVNGGNWREQTNAQGTGTFYIDYTIPEGPTDFVIEAEVFVNGVWK